jgi:hypothetical protein
LDKANTSLKQLSLKEDVQNQSATSHVDEKEQAHNDEEVPNASSDFQIEQVRLDDIAIESIARYFPLSIHFQIDSKLSKNFEFQ